jgi:CRISPR-associated protein Cst1
VTRRGSSGERRKPVLNYTGHPLVDVGLAAIVAFADKEHPEELGEADLDKIAAFMAQQYVKNPLRGFLTVAFPNSGFTQPAFFSQPDKQQTYIDRVLYAYHRDRPQLAEADVFTGLPAADVAFDVSGKLPPGRAYRQHIPLQTGEGTINFHPYGDAGLPVSGLALFAIQAYPLGSAKCAGRTLSIHSDNPEIMVYFARRFLEENRQAIQTAQLENSSKMPEPHLKYRSLIIKILLEALEEQAQRQEDEAPFSITAYHLTNSGQGADLDIYHLPSQLVEFLAEAQSASYRSAWQQIERMAWARFKSKKGQTTAPPDFKPDKNWLYEDLFNLAEEPYRNGRRFIRTYFLREAWRYADPTDPRGAYSMRQESHLVSWKLTDLFLRRILYMEAEKIEQVRHLGDALAAYVREQNDKRFFRAFYTENRYGFLRNSLIKANTAHVKRGNPPFLTLDNYLTVFEDGDDLAGNDWRLARDLVLIRMVEQLHHNGWLGIHQDAIPEVEEETAAES